MSDGYTMPLAAERGEANDVPFSLGAFLALPGLAGLVGFQAFLLAAGWLDGIEGIKGIIIAAGAVSCSVYLARAAYETTKRRADNQATIKAAAIGLINDDVLKKTHAENRELRLRLESYHEQSAEAYRNFDAKIEQTHRDTQVRIEQVNRDTDARVTRHRDGYEALLRGLREESEARIATLESERDLALHAARHLVQDELNKDRPRPKIVLQVEATQRAIEHIEGQTPCPDVEPPLTS